MVVTLVISNENNYKIKIWYTVENIKKLSFKKNKIIFLVDHYVYKDIKKINGKIIVLNTAEKLKDYYEIGKIIKKLIN